MKRNCALSPGQLGCWFGSLAAVSLLLATFFAAKGAWLVVPFTLIEIAALGAAFVWWSRHATDYERIVVGADMLCIETSSGERLRRVERRPAWVRVEYGGARRDPIRIVSSGEAIEIGGLVPEDRRAALARELRGALASHRAAGGVQG
ncbi:DUF2244 domain-containing protein [Burkholderiaceae bacterium FT117]|uniref:DUF2244 domain-containing protein n=1 Tax=Zeimonas sediminis TaxID=2944268 RepID=UPI0023430054|nr:DUF2244 domain-containing protein [Zeimonas sediminis]MCM5571692.1 DUF2244 domain-containing protein [Zeimonas sediminis]